MGKSKNRYNSRPPERIETEFGYVQIEDTTSRGEPVRLYRHNGAFSSGTFLREEKKTISFLTIRRNTKRPFALFRLTEP